MQQFWVFGYGSLMWRPGFDFVENEPAFLRGLHRRLCVYSHVHRGTPERPGLVLGLDRGGSCHGMAFRVEGHLWEKTLSYLRAREQVTSVYLERWKQIRLIGSGRQVAAIAYVIDRRHKQYAGHLGHDALIDYVRQGHGVSGACTDYVLSTAAHLRDMKIRDRSLESLAHELAGQAQAVA